MREIRLSGSEGGGAEFNRLFLLLSIIAKVLRQLCRSGPPTRRIFSQLHGAAVGAADALRQAKPYPDSMRLRVIIGKQASTPLAPLGVKCL